VKDLNPKGFAPPAQSAISKEVNTLIDKFEVKTGTDRLLKMTSEFHDRLLVEIEGMLQTLTPANISQTELKDALSILNYDLQRTQAKLNKTKKSVTKITKRLNKLTN
jgi:ElaB/YqjD/DUF883 family membrane-anchored ribosome-binding protein